MESKQGNDHPSLFNSYPCIFRVPHELRKLKESAYTPRLVSLGPLHRENKYLKPNMKDIKMSYVKSLINRLSDGYTGHALGTLKESVELEDAKKYYAEEIEALDKDMLVNDGCFILELLLRYYDNPNTISSDPLLGSSLMRVTIRHDLLLVENQLPFFVLQKLFDLTVDQISTRSPRYSLRHYVLKFFGDVMTNEKCPVSSDKQVCGEVYFHHILHLLHRYYTPCGPNPKGDRDFMKFMQSASELDFAGVKFEAGKGNNIFNVEFNEDKGPSWWFRPARFQIPPLKIFDTTETFLRNLIAFEQCCYGVSHHFTSYAYLMDTLINNVKDVEVLDKAGVIHNYLGADEDASNLFNKLCKEVVLGEFYFAKTCKDAVGYSERRWPAIMAHVRRNYLASPWTFMAFFVGFTAFGMSVTNFIRSFL